MGRNKDCGLDKFAIATLLMGWLAIVRADAFIAEIDKERLTLTCEGSGVTDTACSLRAGSSGTPTPVRFAAQSTQYPDLLRRGIEKVENNPLPLRPSDADIALLRGLAVDRCHPAVDSAYVSGDLIQLCIPVPSSHVVLFMRGLCDRCEFEPLILKKQAQQ